MSLKPTADQGQRYEISAVGWPLPEKTVIGWADYDHSAELMAAGARLSPGCKRTEIRDRWGKQAIQVCEVEPHETTIALEQLPAKLLRGEHTCFHLTFNDEHSINYETAAEYFSGNPDWDRGWISPEEREKAITTNSVWTLQWYPETPIGFHIVRASSAAAVIAAALKEMSP
ncbi:MULTISPECIES: hypothetical protein [unclassified Rhizobium]|uniref:hypothetical protein n=1 Tax=unclassified Rhizobium TaxID=2613769 RepID=UPI0017C08429|nr:MULTISPECIES: hypothetical protein [unclassified Rhizobium]MBB3386024.1 hypothetical protein [Rhizobium sp. BK098]MBB3617799.1 hypothetical protein [Rhizobium sp. BK609]MBB3683386.1 hypothetical protein [Rhizobium sp. BK612]